jgi:sugar (pentulose or hexulose) kinase
MGVVPTCSTQKNPVRSAFMDAPEPEGPISARTAVTVILLLAAVLRVYDLRQAELNHFDEGVYALSAKTPRSGTPAPHTVKSNFLSLSRLSFANERCVGGKIRLLKNISGLWLVQQCRDDLARQGQVLEYADLTRSAADAEPFRTLVNPDSPAFVSGGDMLAKVTAFAEATRQPAPESAGQFVRCALESLALAYRCVFAYLEQLVGHRIETLHIIGGGAGNDLLNQMTADALDRTVVVGPYEATAVGNALTQAMGVGQVSDLAHLRGIVRQSFDLVTRTPHDTGAFDRQVDRFRELLDK